MPIPKVEELFNPLLESIRDLGGSASISELEDHVVQKLGLSEADLAEEKKSGQRHFSYRLAWARSYLKSYGLLDNSARGVWALTSTGNQTPDRRWWYRRHWPCSNRRPADIPHSVPE